MRRREFITLLGGATIAWPLAARAQQPGAMPVVAFLHSTFTLADAALRVAATGQGPKGAGFIEGQNVAIEYRSAEDQMDRLPLLVAGSSSLAGSTDRRQYPYGAMRGPQVYSPCALLNSSRASSCKTRI